MIRWSKEREHKRKGRKNTQLSNTSHVQRHIKMSKLHLLTWCMIVICIRHRLHPIGYITNRCADKERWGVQFQLCQGVSIMLLNLLLFYVDALKWVKYSTAPSDLEINCGLGSLPNRMLCSSLVNKSVGWPKYHNNYYRWDQIAEKQKFYEILANNAINEAAYQNRGEKTKEIKLYEEKKKERD